MARAKHPKPTAPPDPVDWITSSVRWLDGSPIVLEDYRQDIFRRAFAPGITLVLAGRGKKNAKSLDLVLASLFVLSTSDDPRGADVAIIANDADQAADDLGLAKKLVEVSPALRHLEVQSERILKANGRGTLRILPAGDVDGLHGKSFALIGFDEIHGSAYRDYAIFEALAPDPHRRSLQWITSYAGIYNRPGVPLYDMFERGKTGADPRMVFSWYSSSFTTDPAFADPNLTPEQRANPSMASWPDGAAYLEQQRQRLPSFRYRRLHLNEGGILEGAYYSPEHVERCTVRGRREVSPPETARAVAYCDMSGGSSDDAALAIAFKAGDKVTLAHVSTQDGKAPFDPRKAVEKFAATIRRFGLSECYGDAYGGQTFRRVFADAGITYHVDDKHRSASELFAALEPLLNAESVEFIDDQRLNDQLLSLVVRGERGGHPRIEAPSGEHDDVVNAVAGACVHAYLRGRLQHRATWGGPIRIWSGTTSDGRTYKDGLPWSGGPFWDDVPKDPKGFYMTPGRFYENGNMLPILPAHHNLPQPIAPRRRGPRFTWG